MIDLHRKYELVGNEFKITFVGDLHFNCATPQSRIDDYPLTTVEKLESLRVSMVNSGSKTLVLLGDIFHKTAQTIGYMFAIIEAFKKFKDCGITVYTITGN